MDSATASAVLSKIAELENVEVDIVDSKAGADDLPAASGVVSEKSRAELVKTKAQLNTIRQELAKEKRRHENAKKELETSRLMLSKATEDKSRMENLCRELQKRAQSLKELHAAQLAEERERSKDLSVKCQDILADVQSKIDSSSEGHKSIIEENQKLQSQLKAQVEYAEAQQKSFDIQVKTKDLEKQLETAKYEQQKQIALEEAAMAKAMQEKLVESKQNEIALQKQLAEYGQRMSEVQQTLTDSAATFAEFKKDRVETEKTVKKLLKERQTLSLQLQKAQMSIVQLSQEKTEMLSNLELSVAQRTKLEALCRTLQTERLTMSKELEALREKVGVTSGEGDGEGDGDGDDAAPTEED